MMDLFSTPQDRLLLSPAQALPLATQPAAQAFVDSLSQQASLPNVFNPWADVDLQFDSTPQAAHIRRAQLIAYLSERIHTAKWVLIAEAPGYQGARFSGIAMTSERILLGQHASVLPQHVFSGAAQRTSLSNAVRSGELGMNEPTATVVWSHLLQAGFNPRSFVLWNTFAFHPHHPNEPMSNRTPTPNEVNAAAPLLHQFLALYPKATVLALGRIAQRTLTQMGVDAPALRHPSMGGAAIFRSQMASLSLQTTV